MPKSLPSLFLIINFGIDLVPLVKYWSIRNGSVSLNTYEILIFSFSFAMSSRKGILCAASPHQGSVITIHCWAWFIFPIVAFISSDNMPVFSHLFIRDQLSLV